MPNQSVELTEEEVSRQLCHNRRWAYAWRLHEFSRAHAVRAVRHRRGTARQRCHLAKDLHGARRWTLDVHAVVGARHSEFSTTISKKCHEHCETNFGAECLAIAVNFSHCPVRGETLILHQRCGRNAPRPLDLTPDSTRLLHFIRNLDAISRRGYCSFLGGLVLDSGDIGAAPSSKEPLCQGISSTPVTPSPLSLPDSAWSWRPSGPRTRRFPVRTGSFPDRWSRFRAAPRRPDRTTWFSPVTPSPLSLPDSAWSWRPSGPRTRRFPVRTASSQDRSSPSRPWSPMCGTIFGLWIRSINGTRPSTHTHVG